MEDVVFYGPGHSKIPLFGRWNLSRIIRSVYADDNPDVIVIDHFWHLSRKWKNLNNIEVPKACMVSDPHHEPSEKIEYINRNKVDLALFIYKHSISQFRDRGLECPVGWLPWSADTSVFREYGFEREYDVAFLGAVNRYYPLRQRILEILPRTAGIKFFTARHPGNWNLNPEKDLFRENYAKVLARSKIFIFDNSIWNYPVGKFFEAMACNTLVMAPMPYDGKDLHFEPGFNFVEIDEDNFLEKIRYYLKHEDERREIARQGFETIKQYHTVTIRANQLLEYLRDIRK
jgi:spore maturation protein CgeB